MTETLIFGSPDPNVRYKERLAAYVVIKEDGQVALVREGRNYYLPGGGSLPGETAEQTVVREVREEMARGVRLLRRIGEATQYFYSATDELHYRMLATFFEGELTNEPCGDTPELELRWLPANDAERECFHACHAWAIRQT